MHLLWFMGILLGTSLSLSLSLSPRGISLSIAGLADCVAIIGAPLGLLLGIVPCLLGTTPAKILRREKIEDEKFQFISGPIKTQYHQQFFR